jgi:hypothetical protein
MEQDENDQYYKKSPRRSWVTNQMGNPDLSPGLSHADIVAKLHQVGLSEAPAMTLPSRPSLLSTMFYHYVFDAVMLSVFVGLVILFRRTFPADIPHQTHAA